jgi:nicotinamidase-related amidase
MARSINGPALNVEGKATFSRSGVVTIGEGTSSMQVTLAGVTTSSMVLATAQQARAAHVKAAVPKSGSFTIWLTATAPAGGLKVAYFVLN